MKLFASAALPFFLMASAQLTGLTQQAARDATAKPTAGTASVSGVVVTDEEQPRPVRRAIVTLAGDGLRPSRGAITDDEGRFAFQGLPAGRFTLTATRASFVTSVYGAKRPGRPGTPIVVTDGASIASLTVRLWRGAAVAGVVRDERGAPVSGVPIEAIPARRQPREVLTLTNNGVTTNNRGEFRIFGLEPGTYVVAAKPSSAGASPLIELPEGRIDAAFEALRRRGAPGATGEPPRPIDDVPGAMYALAPVYFPGTVVLSSATPVQLDAGQEVLGLDFALQRARTLVVEGSLSRPDGGSAANAAVQLAEIRRSAQFTSDPIRFINTTSASDGTFRFTQVTPGDYQLVIRAPIGELQRSGSNPNGQIRAGFVDSTLWAMADLSVGGADVTGLALTLAHPLTLSGHVVFEGDSEPLENLSGILISLFLPEVLDAPPGSSVQTIVSTQPVPVRPDGTFALDNLLPGRYRFFTAGNALANSPWWPKSATLDGRDLLDGLVEITADMNLSGLVVTITDKRTELSGTLQTASGAPASDVFVIAYSANRAHWGPAARRVQAVRPGLDGRFTIKDLPAGDYLLAAVLDIDDRDWEDPAFLEQLVPGSIPIALAEGERKTQDLRIGG